MVGDLAALIETLDLDRPTLVGHSWGGNVVLAFAAVWWSEWLIRHKKR